MNEVFYKKCMNPAFFSSIKYTVHSLDDKSMETTILSIADINPYLAACCYSSSETNLELKNTILEKIGRLEVIDPTSGVLLTLAYNEIGVDKEIVCDYVGKTVFFNKKMSEKINRGQLKELWINVDSGYLIQFVKIMMDEGTFWVLPHFLDITRGIYNLSEHEHIGVLKQLYRSDEWLTFFIYLEMNNDYSHLEELDEDYLSKILPATCSYLEKKQKVAPSGRDAIHHAIQRLLFMYVVNSNNPEQRYEEVATTLKKLEVKSKGSGRRFYEKLCQIYAINQYDGMTEEYEVLVECWDSYKNGVDRPYKAYCDELTVVNWNVCHRSYARPISNYSFISKKHKVISKAINKKKRNNDLKKKR